jgi:hypothetical protein
MDEKIEGTKTQWGIVELMGHKVVAGCISKDDMIGKPMLRVDVPATPAYGEFTQFYGEGAIYCVTFTSEDVARLTAEQCRVNPISVYVPDLVTREQVEKMQTEYNRRMNELRHQLTSGESEPNDQTNDDEIDQEGTEETDKTPDIDDVLF